MITNPNPTTVTPTKRHPALIDTTDKRICATFSHPTTVEDGLNRLTMAYSGAYDTDHWRGAIRGLIDRGVLRAVTEHTTLQSATYAVDLAILGKVDPRENSPLNRLHTAELEDSAATVRRAHENWRIACQHPNAYSVIVDTYKLLGKCIDRHNDRVCALARRRAIDIAQIPTEKLR